MVFCMSFTYFLPPRILLGLIVLTLVFTYLFLHKTIYRTHLHIWGYNCHPWWVILLICNHCRFGLAICRHGWVKYVMCVDSTCSMYCPYDFVRSLGTYMSFLDLISWLLRWQYCIKLPFLQKYLSVLCSLQSYRRTSCTHFFFLQVDHNFSSLVAVVAHPGHRTVLRLSCSTVCTIVPRIS